MAETSELRPVVEAHIDDAFCARLAQQLKETASWLFCKADGQEFHRIDPSEVVDKFSSTKATLFFLTRDGFDDQFLARPEEVLARQLPEVEQTIHSISMAFQAPVGVDVSNFDAPIIECLRDEKCAMAFERLFFPRT